MELSHCGEDNALETWDDPILRPLPKVEGAKQRTIRRTRPWEVSAIARSKPMKALKEFYLDLYRQNIASE